MGNLTYKDGSRSGSKMNSVKYQRRFFLARLRRLVAARHQHGSLEDAGSPNLRLLDKAVYSTFCDCLDLGVGEEARTILRHEHLVEPSDGSRKGGSARGGPGGIPSK